MNSSFNIQNFNANNAAINLGGTIEGNQIGTQNYHSDNSEIKEAVAELKTLVTQLQTQHPTVVTETAAIAIIDAEFTEIKQSPNHRLATLRQQLLNPERHAQAIKATVGEVAKHYLEEAVLVKAVITYLDKLSESPEHGA
ncbi:MAG: hypothetical protein HC922_02780 [Leptolyngbyaceae cyanobacterium SM2_3_12]|nr:hypothetical protein [Leptolyngbyaceae cyanobacterium SM2_3_12]